MKLKLEKWGGAWCPSCESLRKRETLEKFAAKYPDVTVSVHDDTENGSEVWSRKADARGIKHIPTLVWVANGEVLFKSNDVTLAGIEAQYAKALKKAGL